MCRKGDDRYLAALGLNLEASRIGETPEIAAETGKQGDTLAAIEAAAATQRDDAIHLVIVEGLGSGHDLFASRVLVGPGPEQRYRMAAR